MNPEGILHHPTIFRMGPLELTGFGLAVLAAFAISQIICQRELWRRGFDKEAEGMPDVVMAALAGTLIGAKTYYVILTGDPSAFFSRGGFVFWGGFIGSVLLCWATIRYRKLSFPRIADVSGIAIAAGYAVGRTGCWAVGDDYGRPWSGPFSVRFPEGAPPSTAATMTRDYHAILPAGTPGDTIISVHPTQLYEVLMGFVMFLIVWRLRKHVNKPGWLFGVYCVLAGVERFIVEFFRAKSDVITVLGLTSAQVVAITVFTIGLVLLVLLRNRSSVALTPSAA